MNIYRVHNGKPPKGCNCDMCNKGIHPTPPPSQPKGIKDGSIKVSVKVNTDKAMNFIKELEELMIKYNINSTTDTWHTDGQATEVIIKIDNLIDVEIK